MVVHGFLFLLVCYGITGFSPELTEEELNGDTNHHVYKEHNHVHAHQTKSVTKHRYVGKGGIIYHWKVANTINIDGTSHTSDAAMDKAATIVSLMIRNVPAEVFDGLVRSNGVGIFAKVDGLTSFPENAILANTPDCVGRCDGTCARTCAGGTRKYADMAGLTNTRSCALDDNILCNSQDPYNSLENVLVHEFGHLVLKYMPEADRQRINYVFNYAKTHRVWYDSYELSNVDEFWAEATSSFFMTVKRPGVYPTGGMNKCAGFTRVCANEMEARAMLKQHDPWLFEMLSKIYTNGHPERYSGLQVCM